LYAIAVTGQGLVDGVVRDLEHHVVQARAVVRVADIHAGTLAHRVKPAQHTDGIGAVGFGGLAIAFNIVCHNVNAFVVRIRLEDQALRRTVPEPIVKNCARPVRGAKSAWSVPDIQAWPPSASNSSNSASRRRASRWAATSSSNSMGAAPVSARTSRAAASVTPIKSAFCSPVEQSSAGIALAR